jgi:hypothetical protein
MPKSKVQMKSKIQMYKRLFDMKTFVIDLAFACLRLPVGRQGRQGL